MYVHGLVNSLQDQLIAKLNVAHGNVPNAKRAFDTLLANYQRNQAIHDGKALRLQQQIAACAQQIQENMDEIERLSDPSVCVVRARAQEPPIEVDVVEQENLDLMLKTDAELCWSQVVQEQIALIGSQSSYDAAVHEEEMRGVDKLRVEVEAKRLVLQNQEAEYVRSLQAIENVLLDKTRVNSVRSGRYSAMGYSRDQGRATTVQDLIGRITAGVDMLRKQERQMELEREVLEKRSARG